MRGLVLGAMIALAACARPGSVGSPEWRAETRRLQIENDRLATEELARREAAERALTPQQRARRDFDAAKVTREDELLERAASASPDYTAAVRRAAIANVEGEAALALAQGARRSAAVSQRAKDAAIVAEEARLSEAVEVRRRQRLADQGRQRQGQQDRQAAANCIALGQQIEASMYSSRSLLNLEAAATGAQARENCWANYQQSRSGP